MARATAGTARVNGGWDSRPERSPAVRVLHGAAIAVVLVGGMIWLMIFTMDNAERVPAPAPDGDAVYVED